jgi:ElaB/YqjD/DUF883 family membrane-anchored ribosome-binding protein
MTITTTDGESRSGTGKNSGGGSAGGTGRARGAAGSVREKASTAYSSSRERTSALYGSARERASGAVTTGRQKIETNPVLAIAGGLALGAILGAVLPRTRREEELLGDVGHRVTDAAKEAANSAVEAGRTQVDELKNSALQKVGSAVVEAVSGAAGGNNNQ